MNEQTKHALENVNDMLHAIERDGINELVPWLKSTDYFTAPSSANYHCAYEGGLVEHSWNVADLLFKKNEQFGFTYSYETLAICGLCHDVCKVNMYKLVAEDPSPAQMKYLTSLCNGKLPTVPGKLHKGYVSKLIDHLVNKTEKRPEYTPGEYKIEDQFPVGHGEKSVLILRDLIELTEEEMLAIRWHMGAWDLSPLAKYAYDAAVKRSPLVTLLMTADMEASAILEK